MDAVTNKETQFRPERFNNVSLIPTSNLKCLEFDTLGTNINGPSVIRVPEWIENPLGTYYLYFAHHKGTFIRMAYAASVDGPYRIYIPGVLNLEKTHFPTDFLNLPPESANENPAWEAIANNYANVAKKHTMPSTNPLAFHIASPDVIVDDQRKIFVMTLHGLEGKPKRSSQLSRVATSKDGLHFETLPDAVGLPYMRHFINPLDTENHYYIAMPGIFYKSKDAFPPFECREIPLETFKTELWMFDYSMRHAACVVDNNQLHVFWTRVGDAPERILVTTVELKEDWTEWNIVGKTRVVLRPELEWEGSAQPIEPSERGEVYQIVNQLRDPFAFQDHDGQLYLFYTGGGEMNIGIVKLIKT